jgi:hypothetical protein
MLLDEFSSPASSQEVQVLLKQTYIANKQKGILPPLSTTGFRKYSQFEEDGLLLYVFSVIGEKSKRVVEICCGTGRECMSANLIINHGWDGLLFDGDKKLVESAKKFFLEQKDCQMRQPEVINTWITVENVNELIRANGFYGEIDLLSLDLDGNDYWIWEAINVISPRVCIFETSNMIPGDFSLTIPYDPKFFFSNKSAKLHDFRSASLLAMRNLSVKKGYRLIGGHRLGFNAIFMRNDIGLQEFPEVSIKEIHDNQFTRWLQEHHWPKVKNLPWVEV